MLRLMFQAIFLAFALIANLYMTGDASAELVCGTLLSICCASVGEYARSSVWNAALLLVLDCGACIMPSWCAMVPIAAYNVAMLPAASHDADRQYAIQRQQASRPHHILPRIIRIVVRWAWLAPAVAAMLRCHGASANENSPMVAALLILHMILGFAVGMLCARNIELAWQNKRLQDSRRDQIRRLRSQLAESEEDRAASVRAATLAERTRIAREIHDNVGHMLTRAIMQSEASQVVAQVSGQEQAAQGFAQIRDTVGEAMTLVRGAVHDLKDEGTDFVAQIEASAHGFDGSSGVKVMLSNGIDAAPAAVSRCFATTIREALNNTIRHSMARNVDIVLRDFPALWQLRIQDDGALWSDGSQERDASMMGETSVRIHQFRSAVRKEAMQGDTGIGLADIEERARALGGTAVCGPYHEGWRVFVSIPKTDNSTATHMATKENV